MGRIDRALGILLLLSDGRTCSAADLAQRFEVSPRTIYRDVDALSAEGVPVYAEMGRRGGFRLLPGYFLPPVMLSEGEAITLLLGLTYLRGLPDRPFAAELELAHQKLLGALPERLRAALAETQKVVGFEGSPNDLFHPEPPSRGSVEDFGGARSPTEATIATTTFLRAVLSRRQVVIAYRSPNRSEDDEFAVEPLGLFWDRGRCYLVGRRMNGQGPPWLWRADRVRTIQPGEQLVASSHQFDVRELLGRAWLKRAISDWVHEAPVRIRLSRAQANRLRQDWYYRHATYDEQTDGRVIMTFGESDRSIVFELVRWLGPEAELLAPEAWRTELKSDLACMAKMY